MDLFSCFCASVLYQTTCVFAMMLACLAAFGRSRHSHDAMKKKCQTGVEIQVVPLLDSRDMLESIELLE